VAPMGRSDPQRHGTSLGRGYPSARGVRSRGSESPTCDAGLPTSVRPLRRSAIARPDPTAR
jgi:hypothetical protein